MNPSSYYSPIDNRWHHFMRQSFVGTMHQCPEKARLENMGNLQMSGDSAIAGTAVHQAIEDTCRYMNDETFHEPVIDQDFMYRFIIATAEAEAPVQMTKFEDAEQMAEHAYECFQMWEREYGEPLFYPMIEAEQCRFEHRFQHVIHEDDERVIYIQGTIDSVFFDSGVFDWKTSAKDYKREGWKMQRYNAQAPIYSYAARQLVGKVVPFELVRVAIDCKSHERFPIQVRPNDVKAIFLQLHSYAKLIEASLDQWPMSASDWHCNEKWCAAFARKQCVGEFLSINPEYELEGESNGNDAS